MKNSGPQNLRTCGSTIIFKNLVVTFGNEAFHTFIVVSYKAGPDNITNAIFLIQSQTDFSVFYFGNTSGLFFNMRWAS